MQSQLAMRELTLDEIEAVSGAGFWSDLWSGIENFFTASAEFLGFDGRFGAGGGSGGFFGAVGNLFGGNVSYFSTETITTNDLPNGDTEVVVTLHRGSGDTIWTLPNTALGLAVGQAGYAFDHVFGDGSANVAIANGNLVFTDDPFNASAITLGHVLIVGESLSAPNYLNATLAHEQAHVAQGNLLGPLYLPSNLVGGGAALLFDGNWHGPTNWNETGPQLSPPQGRVAICVGIDFGVLSGELKLSFHAARSMA